MYDVCSTLRCLFTCPVWRLSTSMMSAYLCDVYRFMVFSYPLDFCLPMWYLLTCIKSAQLYDVQYACQYDVCSTDDVCLPVISNNLCDVCSTLWCLPTWLMYPYQCLPTCMICVQVCCSELGVWMNITLGLCPNQPIFSIRCLLGVKLEPRKGGFEWIVYAYVFQTPRRWSDIEPLLVIYSMKTTISST